MIGAPEHPYTRALLAAIPEVGTHRLLADPTNEAATGDGPAVGGCEYRSRCAIGPVADATREICRTDDPFDTAGQRRHHAACHFAHERIAATVHKGQ